MTPIRRLNMEFIGNYDNLGYYKCPQLNISELDSLWYAMPILFAHELSDKFNLEFLKQLTLLNIGV